MRLTPDVSRHKLVARWLVAAILMAGVVLQRGPQAVALASIAYFGVEGYRVQSVAERCGASTAELVASSGWFLRRGFLWALIGLAIFFTLLVWWSLAVTVVSVVLLYTAGLFAQAVRAAEDEHLRGDERRGRSPETDNERRPEDDRRPPRTESTGE
ncbi:hypothetical protein M0R89_14140 [Halorussus limi]|uniref:Uncharacterized protein n=1 Tax=Halorussus limi TaxID=2938695 RepID=A0A8U0HSM9_9EURY|nr:hypothetical protein [Halorussus limi]UPV73674.1 hypothetical protein M0R89_14140 [Halorussus limi]